jgi:uncharacterized protein YyaL (SSP411 family)
VLSAAPVDSLLRDRFVPIRVGADLRPDIAIRYGLGGWPSILVLTPEGDVLTGGQWVDAEHLAPTLAHLAAVFHDHRVDLLRAAVDRPPLQTRSGGLPPFDPAGARRFFATLIARGETSPGDCEGFPWYGKHGVVHALVAGAQHFSDRRLLALAEWALELQTIDEALDRQDGAVPLATTGVDGRPLVEHVALLDVCATVLELLIDASVLLERDDLRARAAAVAGFIVGALRHPEGGFVHAVAIGQGTPAAAGALDPRRFVDANAVAARSLLSAAHWLHDASLAEAAIEAIERVLLATYQRGAGVAHVADGEVPVRGLLGDQVEASAALVRAFDASGMRVYLDLAEELMRSVLRKYCEPGGVLLLDRVPTTAGAGDVGRLGQPFHPVSTTCLAAEVLAALSERTGEAALLAHGRGLLASCAPLCEDGMWDRARHALACMALEGADASPSEGRALLGTGAAGTPRE